MENKIYTDQSTAFDHLNIDRELYFKTDKNSKTLEMKRMITVTIIDSVIISFMLVIASFLL
ncbi:MAG: hypothetical protein ACR2GN_04875 [Bacteroidia bacterium]